MARSSSSGPGYIAINLLSGILFFLSMTGLLLIIYQIGFDHDQSIELQLGKFYSLCVYTFTVIYLARILILMFISRFRSRAKISEFVLLVISALVATALYLQGTGPEIIRILSHQFTVFALIGTVFLVELSKKSLNLLGEDTNPAKLFVASFLILILLGTGFLLLPHATTNGISLIDAIFTATSAVCVTGLIVQDTATFFTPLGQNIILCLIQLGGLGVMTFTSFFGFFFKGETSFRNQVLLSNYSSESKLGDIFRTFFKIVFITFFAEAAGAAFIYINSAPGLFESSWDRLYFSVFHAISAFCNAGFTNIEGGLNAPELSSAYGIHIILSLLIISGGLGFPILFNYYRLSKHYIKNWWQKYIFKKPFEHSPRIININTRLVIRTTLILLAFGLFAFFITEYSGVLEGRSFTGKVITAFFASVTTRTAGFNTFDMEALAPATILIFLFLMWIGASPRSTGGGIKTSTAAVAALNIFNIAKGLDRIEFQRREVSSDSVRKAFAAIFLSCIVIGLSLFLLVLSEPEKEILNLIFEVVSAFSTVGLTLGTTDSLSVPGKVIIVITMFLGRVGTFTLLLALIKKISFKTYNYPEEEIYIN